MLTDGGDRNQGSKDTAKEEEESEECRGLVGVDVRGLRHESVEDCLVSWLRSESAGP